MRIEIPQKIRGEGLVPFLAGLAEVDGQAESEMIIDLRLLASVTPAAMVALSTYIDRWKRQGRAVRFEGHQACKIIGYLQRMDLLGLKDANLVENFVRHSSRGRFVPVQCLDGNVDAMGCDLALCLAPGGDDWEHEEAALYDFSFYVFTEVANNVRQHSSGVGYASAQVSPTERMVRIAIGDNGRGIRQSFIDAGFDWATEISDSQAILKALEPRVSSKGPGSIFGNEGVGLTLVSQLVKQTHGWLLVASGSGLVKCNQHGKRYADDPFRDSPFRGTLVTMVFDRKCVVDFASILQQAKSEAGLLPTRPPRVRFNP